MGSMCSVQCKIHRVMETGMELWRAWRAMLKTFDIYSLGQHFPIELYVMVELFISALLNTVATGHRWLFSTCNVTNLTEKLKS